MREKYESLALADLRAIAKNRGIKGSSTMKKADPVEAMLAEDEKDKKSGKYIRRERYAGACERSFYVGEGISQDDIKASFQHGILKLFIPKEPEKSVEEKKYVAIEG